MDPKREKQLTWLLSFPVLGVLIFLGFVPIMWPVASYYEGEVFPVIRNVDVELREEVENGIIIDVSFDKIRACEFLGISWFDTFGDRAPIIFQVELGDEEGSIPYTRPVRDDQNAGPWKLIGIDELDGSIAIVSHRCHPLWITYTRFYP